ncbi:MAG: hypothetical protein V4739_09315 [Pseudomonadota bacterium]
MSGAGRLARQAAVAACVGVLLLAIGLPAWACKPLAGKPADYLKGNALLPVVAVGTVIAVEETPLPDGARRQDIEFKVSRWYRGRWFVDPVALDVVRVRGVVGGDRGSACDSEWRFSAQPGEEWLLFGSYLEGAVEPTRWLSQPLTDGQIPAPLLRELMRHDGPVHQKRAQDKARQQQRWLEEALLHRRSGVPKAAFAKLPKD